MGKGGAKLDREVEKRWQEAAGGDGYSDNGTDWIISPLSFPL